MEEIWSKISIDDIRREITDYDRRMAHYGNGPALLSGEEESTPHKVQPSPFSPSSSLSSPSPSPSTPYSPSNPIKKDSRAYTTKVEPKNTRNPKEFVQTTKGDVYSPSSPSSSPETNRKKQPSEPRVTPLPPKIAAASNSPASSRNSPTPTQNLIIPPPLHCTPYTFVWDLDDTLVLFDALRSEEYARLAKKNPKLGVKLFQRLDTLLYKVMDRFMFFRQIEKIDLEANIANYSIADDGKNLREHDFTSDRLFRNSSNTSYDPVKLAYRYRIMKDMYEGTIDIRKLFSRGLYDELMDVCLDIDQYSDGWLSQARKCLQIAAEE
jgi:hypothetical protein